MHSGKITEARFALVVSILYHTLLMVQLLGIERCHNSPFINSLLIHLPLRYSPKTTYYKIAFERSYIYCIPCFYTVDLSSTLKCESNKCINYCSHYLTIFKYLLLLGKPHKDLNSKHVYFHIVCKNRLCCICLQIS